MMAARGAPRRIVITGVSRGLGRALALAFARRGHAVCGCARDARALSALQGDLGPGHDLAVVDVGDDAAVAAWAARVQRAREAPDLVVANAALINRSAPLWEVPAAEFESVVRVNVLGVAAVARHFVPLLLAAGRGGLVHLSSGWGRATDRDVAPYCATKWAVEGLTQALAQELPPPLFAVAVNPGIIDTDMLRSCFGAAAGQYESPATWAERAAPFMLGLDRGSNGRPLTVPGP